MTIRRPAQTGGSESSDILGATPPHRASQHIGKQLLEPPVPGAATSQTQLGDSGCGQRRQRTAGEESHGLERAAKQRASPGVQSEPLPAR